MKTYLFAVLSTLLILASCGGTEENKSDEKNQDSVKGKKTEKIVNEDVKKPTDDEFSKFEHYAKITTKKELIKKFGAENIINTVELFAEGTEERQVSLLTNPKNKQVIKYVWKDTDNETLSWLEANLFIYDKNGEAKGSQKIETVNGLWLGMSLAELRKWNGANFKFSGFDWDYGGGIYAEKGSKIFDSKVKATLYYNDTNIASFALGDVELFADDARLKNAKIFISSLSFHSTAN